jgi:hypothetical protein
MVTAVLATAVTMPAITCFDVFLTRLSNFTATFATMTRAFTAFNSTEQSYQATFHQSCVPHVIGQLSLLILSSEIMVGWSKHLLLMRSFMIVVTVTATDGMETLHLTIY